MIATTANIVIREILEGVTPERLAQLALHFSTQKTVPPEYDRPQMSTAFSNRRFSSDEARHIRGLFVRAVRGSSPDSIKPQ
jgi:hypothetical protein